MPSGLTLKLLLGILLQVLVVSTARATPWSLAAEQHVQGQRLGLIEYMALPPELDVFDPKARPLFEPDGVLSSQLIVPKHDVNFLIRVYPASRQGWTMRDCALVIDPGFVRGFVRWVGPSSPESGLIPGRGLRSGQLRGGLCHEWDTTIEYFEFVIMARSGLALRVGYPPLEELLLGNDAEYSMVMFLGLTLSAIIFACSLAVVIGSVRILFQSVSTLLLLSLLTIRFGGGAFSDFIDSELISDHSLPGRIFALFGFFLFGCVVWELEFKRKKAFLTGLALTIGGLALLPLSTLRSIHPNPLILIGGLPLLAGLVLNLYLLFIRRGETLVQLVRSLRLFLLILLSASAASVTGRLELPSLAPFWHLGLICETVITLVVALKEQRSFEAIGRLLEERSIELETKHERVRERLQMVESSHFELLRKNEEIEKANAELQRAIDEVSSVGRIMNKKRQRLHFAELLGFRLAGLGHDLMNPLGLARGIMELLPSDAWSEHDKECRAAFIDEIDRMTALRSAVRIFGRPEIIQHGGGEERIRAFEVQKTIESGVELFKLSGGECQIETSFGEMVVANGAAGDLSRVIVELLSNAERAAALSRNEPRVRLELSVLQQEVHITIEDSGDGFPKGGLAVATLGFMSLSDTLQPQQFHIGLGLVMCVRLVADLGGELTVRDERSELGGAIVEIVLPIVGQGSTL